MSEILHPSFWLSGQFDPDEITSRLGFQPTWVTRIGDPGPLGATSPRLGAEWAWQPEDDDSNDVGDQLAYLAGSLSLMREEVSELSKAFSGKFVVYEQFRRDWFLSAETLRLIANLHVDIYCLNAPYEESKEVSKHAD